MTTTVAEPVVLADTKIDPDEFMLAGIDTSSEPRFTVSEVAKFFFARSAHWIRWRERRSFFVLDGAPDCPHTDSEVVPAHVNEDGKNVPKKIIYNTWIEDGKCSHCGGRAVGDSRTGTGARYYSLSDTEEIAHALAQRGAISGSQLRTTLQIIKSTARNYGYL